MNRKYTKIFLTKESEERWLNQLSSQGWRLERKKGINYYFQRSEPNQESYRIECRDKSIKHDDLITSFKSKNIHLITIKGRWIYCRKPVNQGGFNLYSDIQLRASYYQNLAIGYIILAIILLGLSVWLAFSHLLALLILPLSLFLFIFSGSLLFRAIIYKKSKDIT